MFVARPEDMDVGLYEAHKRNGPRPKDDSHELLFSR